jgi:hypothetical protein
MYTFALNGEPSIRNVQTFDMPTPNPNLPPSHPGAHGGRYFTIQRVNGNGANGKNDGVGGGHQHTLEESDRVKKSSVQRFIMKDKKDRRTRAVCLSHGIVWSYKNGPVFPACARLRHSQHLSCFRFLSHADGIFILMSTLGIILEKALTQYIQQDRVMSQSGPKLYHTKSTGLAAETAIKHSADVNLKLFGSCFW